MQLIVFCFNVFKVVMHLHLLMIPECVKWHQLPKDTAVSHNHDTIPLPGRGLKGFHQTGIVKHDAQHYVSKLFVMGS